MAALLAALILTGGGPAWAHEKWFHQPDAYPLRPDLMMRPLPLLFLAGVLAVTALVALVWRARGQRGFVPGPEAFGATPDRRAALYGLVPLLLAIHVAVPLLVNGVQGHLFSPDNPLPGPWRYFLGLAQTGIALALFYGALTRLAAVALAALWGLGLFVVGPEPMLDNVFFLGFAAFFFFAGRGPIAVDRFLFPRLEPRPERLAWAVPALRIGLGLSLIVVAFTEKFANLPLALAFLDKFPLNFTPAFGMPLANEVFVLCAGSVELLVGLCLLLGLFPREIVLIAWIPINMTLTIFNWVELVGHLPIYGIMAVLLVWAASSEENRAAVAARFARQPVSAPHGPGRCRAGGRGRRAAAARATPGCVSRVSGKRYRNAFSHQPAKTSRRCRRAGGSVGRGCGDLRPLTSADFAPAAAQQQHGHRSAHGGTVVSVGDTHHVEALVEPKADWVRVFVLGEDETELFPIPAKTLAAEASTAAGETRAFPLQARPQPGDPAGQAAEFAGKLPTSNDIVALTVTLPLGPKRHRVRVALLDDTGSNHAAAETAKCPRPPQRAHDAPTPAERALFLTPGGRYTEADIRANGGLTAPQKFQGMMSQHNARPAPGERICPISRTKANPRFAWIIRGQKYLFCCPPCVGEFLQQAKTAPNKIRPAATYLQQSR
jgi:uncharacterized membrane protein YphA (DoxX/SURF4 family)